MFILVLFAVLCGAQQFQDFQLPDPPSDLRVDCSGTVFVAAGNELFRLDSDFVQQESMELAMSPTAIQRIALSQDGSRVVVCLDDESCAVYNASNFEAGPLLTRGGVTASMEVTVFTSPSESFYAGSYGTVLSTNVIYLTQYGFGGSEFIRKSANAYNGNAAQLVRNFYGGFIAGPNAYYIVYDSNPSGLRGVRVLRICDQGPCPGPGVCEIDALYETQLGCGPSTAIGASTAICDVSLLSTFDGTPQNRLVVSLCETGRNRICSYNLAEIDTAMDTLYSQCSAGTGTASQPVWIGGSDLSCSGFMVFAVITDM